MARTIADLDGAHEITAAHVENRGTAPERRAMTGPSGTSRPPSSPLDALELSAAVLACLPDMTPARLRATLARWGGPVGALAACGRGGGACTPHREGARRRPPREARAGGAVAPGRRRRPHPEHARASRHHASTSTAARGIRSATTCPTARRCCSRKATIPASSTGHGRGRRHRAATPHGLADAPRSVQCSGPQASRSWVGSRSASMRPAQKARSRSAVRWWA